MNIERKQQIDLDNQIQYLNKDRNLKYEIISVQFKGESRLVIAIIYRNLMEHKWILIPKDFHVIILEYGYYSEIIQCENCSEWVKTSELKTVAFYSRKKNERPNDINVCEECYGRLFKRYRRSRHYRDMDSELKETHDHLEKHLTDDETITSIIFNNEKRLALRTRSSFSGNYSYDLIHRRANRLLDSQLIIKCAQCKRWIRLPEDGRLFHSHRYCFKCLEDQQLLRKRSANINLILKRQLLLELLSPKINVNNDLGNDCCLTGNDFRQTEMDHFVALSTGHIGTAKGNYYPLSKQLNCSKSNSNPFEWIKRSDIKNQINMEKWDRLIKYNADAFNLTLEAYQEFVYWCYENPRDINDILMDGQKTSLELWKESKA